MGAPAIAAGRHPWSDAVRAIAGPRHTRPVRRARPLLETTVYRILDFRLLTDFGGTAPNVFDAYAEVRVRPALAVRAGKFKPPVGLERLQSATDLRFAERGLPTNLAPNRDFGFQIGGELDSGLVSYQVGIFNGVPDLGNGTAELGDHKDLVGRLFFTPFVKRGARAAFDLGVGLGASTGHEDGSTAATGLPSYVSPGQITVFRYRSSGTAPATGTVYALGRRTRIYPQAYLNYGPVGLLAEYAITRQDVSRDTGSTRLEHKAWQVAWSWFLTGEKASFRSVTPKKPFDATGAGWGAVELAVRYGEIDLDRDTFPYYADPKASVSKAKAWAVGVNWHLARNVKLTVDYEKTRFTGGVGATPTTAPVLDRPDETFIVTRLQTAF